MRHGSRAVGFLLGAALIACSCIAPRGARAWEGLAPYADESSILATTPSTDDGTLGAMFNPAQWGVLQKAEMSFFWSDVNVRPNAMDNWGLAFGKDLGVSIRRHDELLSGEPRHVTDWQIGIGGGGGRSYHGIAYGFSGEGKGAFDRENFIGVGDVYRPARWLSYGTTARFALSGGDIDGIVDVGIRPLGDPRVLLFGDYALSRGDRWDDGPLSGGLAIRPVPGIEAAARWGDEDRIRITLGLTLQRSGFRAAPEYDRDGTHGATRYTARLNPPVRGMDVDARAMQGRRFVEMDLKGQAVYQGYRYGDKESIPLRPLLERLQLAAEDPTVSGVALNLSGFQTNVAMNWEIRQKLVELRARGKKVVVYVDNLGTAGYYLASAADVLVMDPRGYLLMPGVQISRTYLKGTLDKLGLGFDEWRYYKYKSALETFSRTNMSPADSEQLQELTDMAYGELAQGVVSAGRSTREAFDRTVNEEPVLTAKRLLELRWIDRIGRPEDLKTIAREAAGRRVALVSPGALAARRWQPDEEWGPKPKIALVYATGPCAMDEGIKGRDTSKQLRRYRKDRDVKAVVLRADSPGGDPLPSDLVAGELRALHKVRKPAIVTQGRVAASGGYWISLDADTILTTPFTVTASIGVIGGWVWNKGFSGKTGLTADQVKHGTSADLTGGLKLPILGATLPERNLTAPERKQVERLFSDLYDDFVGKVAAARKLDPARVREIAEGRVWIGPDAVRLGLVDRVGGLTDAIEAAKRAAGIPRGRKVEIEEYPKPPLFRVPQLAPSILADAFGGLFGRADDGAQSEPGLTYESRVLQEIIRNPGEPLLLTPATLLPAEGEAAH